MLSLPTHSASRSQCQPWAHCHATGVTPRQRRGPPARTTHIARTSEFWWEDELEYDAVTEVLAPKRVHVVAVAPSSRAVAEIRSRLASLKLQTGFTGSQTEKDAQQIWAGRCVAPFFYKLRSRAILDELAAEEVPSSGQQAEEFWSEVAGQNWRVELDYGLAGAAQDDHEALLIVATRLAAIRLLQAADPDVKVASGDGTLHAVVAFRGWGSGEDAGKTLESWRQLQPFIDLQEMLAA